jgi:anhydro-N-acetylmuramic acid kinase
LVVMTETRNLDGGWGYHRAEKGGMVQAIGLMSGTSLDGVDAAWLETDGRSVTAYGPSTTIPYDAALRQALRALLDRAPLLAPNDHCLRDIEIRLTDYHVRAVRALARQADVIGFHGQTILHQPERRRTWQIGDAQHLASMVGLPVVHQFRLDDVTAGGQGAPLAPVYHQALAHGLPKPLAVLNIGGVANVTWIGDDGALLAFDTGPGNALLDDWVNRHCGASFDQDGALALAGHADRAVVSRLMALPYFRLPGPKSLDRLAFGEAVRESGVERLSAPDGAATLARFTVEAIAAARFPRPPVRWIVCGGGRHNPALMAGLRQLIGVPVEAAESVGWDGDALEAQCFGYLAVRIQAGLPTSFPGTTGVARPTGGGRIAMPAP